MSTQFLEPGGDADFAIATTNGMWRTISGSPSVATDFVHGNHVKSIQYRTGNLDAVSGPLAVVQDAGARVSFYMYLNALPNATAQFFKIRDSSAFTVVGLYLTSGGILRLENETPTQLGSDGPTLSIGGWYRIALCYNITSTSVNQFTVYVNGVSAITVTNGTLTRTASNNFLMGNNSSNATLDIRTSDHYIDNSSSQSDPGNIWVTAKRPFSNGTTNDFSTQIGSGGSSYGSGHAPQVNERALSVTNGWSAVVSGTATTEEYSIEGKAVGNFNLSGASIVDYLGWVSTSALNSETASIIVAGSSSNISLTTTNTVFKKIAGSTVYPAGNTAIGITTATTSTTVSLFECGIIVAFIPGASPSTARGVSSVTGLSTTNF